MKSRDRKTQDRGNDFFTTGKVGRTREVTPEGFLLCRHVPIARTGDLVYGPDETPIEVGVDGTVIVTRDEETLFHPDTMASFEGKSVTNDHPDEWVSPENWKQLTVGVTQNVRRGEGAENHLMIADLLITDAQAIKDVNEGKREVSNGYDADYEQIAPGRGRQLNIIGNHVALVKNGRCGTRCGIGDKQTMSKKKVSWLDRLRGAKDTIDEALEEAEKEKPTEDGEPDGDPDPDDKEGKTGDAVLAALKAMDAKWTKKFNVLDKRIRDQENDPEKKTEDNDLEDEGKTSDEGDLTEPESAQKIDESGVKTMTGDSMQQVRSQAAILAPSYKAPTVDAKSKDAAKLVRTIKVNALNAAWATADGKTAINPFLKGHAPDFGKLPAATLDAIFDGASVLMGERNNLQFQQQGTRDNLKTAGPKTAADLNKRNADFWSKNKG